MCCCLCRPVAYLVTLADGKSVATSADTLSPALSEASPPPAGAPSAAASISPVSSAELKPGGGEPQPPPPPPGAGNAGNPAADADLASRNSWEVVDGNQGWSYLTHQACIMSRYVISQRVSFQQLVLS